MNVLIALQQFSLFVETQNGGLQISIHGHYEDEFPTLFFFVILVEKKIAAFSQPPRFVLTITDINSVEGGVSKKPQMKKTVYGIHCNIKKPMKIMKRITV